MSNKNMPFSEREGIVPQREYRSDIDQRTRNAIYNQIHEFLNWSDFACCHRPSSEAYDVVYKHHFWAEFLSKPVDEYENREFLKPMLIRDNPWWRVFEFVEYILDQCACCYDWDELSDIYSKERADSLAHKINSILGRARVNYKISGNKFVPCFPELEQHEVEKSHNTGSEGVNHHIEKALGCLGYKNPDFGGAIRESIHAVESIAKEITGKEKSLNALTQGLKLHPDLTTALNELYNWTSKDGIRHGKSGKPLSVNQDTARFMLVTCSAFVNYIIARNQATQD